MGLGSTCLFVSEQTRLGVNVNLHSPALCLGTSRDSPKEKSLNFQLVELVSPFYHQLALDQIVRLIWEPQSVLKSSRFPSLLETLLLH